MRDATRVAKSEACRLRQRRQLPRTIRSGASEIASAADDLSRRTEQQAASLEETAAALDEITATVRRTASGAKDAATLVADMTGNRFARAGLPGSVTRWYWVRHIDRSGNVSAWFPGGAGAGISGVTISPSGGGVRVVTDASVITAGTGSPPPGGDDYWAVYDNATGKIWRWSLVLGAYTKAADGGDITAGSIAADKIAVANLAAINADLGSITAGAIDIGGGKFSVASDGTTIIRNATTGARLEVRNNVIKVYDASGTLRVKLGDLSA